MLTLPHALKEIGPPLRAEVQVFLQAVEQARRFGFLTEVAGQGSAPAGGVNPIGAEWAPSHLGVALPGLPHAFAADDIALVRRGVLHLLALNGDESAIGQAQPLATSVPDIADDGAMSPPSVVSGASSTDFSEPFHLHLWFVDPVEDPVLDGLAEALVTFEQLAVGLRPLAGDVFADMGATSLSLLEPEHVQIWIDGVYAEASDWQGRVGRMLARLNRRRPLRAIVYDGS